MDSSALRDWHTVMSLGRPRGREEPQARKGGAAQGSQGSARQGEGFGVVPKIRRPVFARHTLTFRRAKAPSLPVQALRRTRT